jgi:hypothetical protein
MIFVEAPIDPNCQTKSIIKNVQIDEDLESVEWIKTTLPDGTFFVSGYNIVRKQIYNS